VARTGFQLNPIVVAKNDGLLRIRKLVWLTRCLRPLFTRQQPKSD